MTPVLSARRAWPAAVLGGLLVLGAVGGLLWEVLWTPPSGVAVEGRFVLDGAGARSAFSGTALFVLISAGAGLLGGVAIGWVTRRDEIAVLVAAVLGAVGGTALMYVVGHAMGPPDPAVAAAVAEDLTPLRDQLTLAGSSPYLVMTSGVLIGLVVTMLGFGNRRDPAGPDPSDPVSLQWRPRDETTSSQVSSTRVTSSPSPDPTAHPGAR